MEDDLQNIFSDKKSETVRQLSGESGLSGWARLARLLIIYLLFLLSQRNTGNCCEDKD